MAFLHWQVPAESVLAHLPPQLEVDEHEGRAWIGLVAFDVSDFRIAGLVLPGRTSRFGESNVRTYVRDRGGRDGVWFLALDVASWMTFTFGKLVLQAPYRLSDTSTTANGRGHVTYRNYPHVPHRDHPDWTDLQADISEPRQPDELDHFLTGRWRAYVRPRSRLLTVGVEHEPWPLHQASINEVHQPSLAAFGIDPDRRPDHVRWSPGVHARIGNISR